MVTVICPTCKRAHSALESLAGKWVQCKHCGAKFLIKSRAPDPLQPPPAEKMQQVAEAVAPGELSVRQKDGTWHCDVCGVRISEGSKRYPLDGGRICCSNCWIEVKPREPEEPFQADWGAIVTLAAGFGGVAIASVLGILSYFYNIDASTAKACGICAGIFGALIGFGVGWDYFGKSRKKNA